MTYPNSPSSPPPLLRFATWVTLTVIAGWLGAVVFGMLR